METPRPSRRERRTHERATRKEQEAARESRRTLLKRLAAAAGVAGVGGAAVAVARSLEPHREKSFKEKVLSFTWKEAEDPEKLKAFIESLADGYLQLTQSTRVTKEELVKTNIYYSREDYLREVRKVSPNYNSRQTAFTHYETRKVFLDLALQKRYVEARGNDLGGLFLINLLWHEWGHLDVTERTHGENINNPRYFFATPRETNEMYIRYRGAEIFTETYYGYKTFEEVLNETITNRRLIEQVGIPQEGRYREVITTSDYYPNGTAVFLPFTMRHIPLDQLYNLHATSDFEGQAKLVGQYLPGNEPPFARGERLFIALHKADPMLIRQTGVFERIPR